MFNDYQALFLLWQKIKFTILIMLRVQFCGIKKKKTNPFLFNFGTRDWMGPLQW